MDEAVETEDVDAIEKVEVKYIQGSLEGTWHRVNPLSPFAVDLYKHQRATLFRHIAPTYTIRETT